MSQTAHQPDPAPDGGARARRAGVGLCLSGGGYRAALFHLGATRRLNELGVLGQLRTISAVSGGAIIANLLASPELHWPADSDADSGADADADSDSDSDAESDNTAPADATAIPSHLMVDGFDEHVAQPLRALTSHNTRTPALFRALAPQRWGRPDAAVRALANQFALAVPWWSMALQDRPIHGPAFVTGATDVAYGVDWTFDAPTAARPAGRMGDYRLGHGPLPEGLRVADAVAASCAFPPFFAPMLLDGAGLSLRGGHPGRETPTDRAAVRRGIRLTDGGIYDNLALEPVWKSHQTVLVSDGGAVFRARSERTPWGRLLQVLGIATGASQVIRTRWLQASIHRGALSGATWSIGSRATRGRATGSATGGVIGGVTGGVIGGRGTGSATGSSIGGRATGSVPDPPLAYPDETIALIEGIRTDLDAFSLAEQQILERHGYLVADRAIHAHQAHLITRDAPVRPPHPEVADPAVVAAALRGSSRRRLLGRRGR